MLLATILGSGMAMLDSTIVNVALPHIGRDLDADVAGLQWTANGYLLTLSALILLGGSLGDRLGRRRVFVVGAVWFAAASLLCGVAPSVSTLVAARMLQGVGGALLTPGSLAIISASFAAADRGRAIGAWSGLTGVFGAAGPFVGGWIVDALSWRWAFLVNVPIALAVVAVAARHVPESRGDDPEIVTTWHGLDVRGALLAAAALGLVSWALVTAPERGPTPAVVATGLAGLLAGAAFVAVETRTPHPMVPPSLFTVQAFSATNAVTFLAYGGLGGVLFTLVLTLQVAAGFSPLAAGAAILPLTLLMLLLSPRVGGLATRTGARLPMTVGLVLGATGVALASRIGSDARYLQDVVPPLTLLGTGMALTVAPLTTTVLDAAPGRYAGIASGVNNAVARAASLLVVAALPLVVGLSGDAYRDPRLLLPAFRTAMLVCAGLYAAAALLSAVAVPGRSAAAPEGFPLT